MHSSQTAHAENLSLILDIVNHHFDNLSLAEAQLLRSYKEFLEELSAVVQSENFSLEGGIK